MNNGNFINYWNMDGNDIINRAKKFINKSIATNQKLLKLNLDHNAERNKFIALLSDDTTEFTICHSICNYIKYITSDNQLKYNCIEAEELLTKYINNLNQNRSLYEKIIEFKKKSTKLSSEDIRFINRVIVEYQRNGIHLNSRDQKKLFIIKNEILKLEQFIEHSINKYDHSIIEFNVKDLKGLPNIILKSFPKLGSNSVGIRMVKNNYNHCMRYIDDPSIRKKIYKLYSSRSSDTSINIVKLAILRHKMAQLLSSNKNFQNYTDFKLNLQMARTSTNVTNFLINFLKYFDVKYVSEITTLLKIKKNSCKNSKIKFDNQIHIWDLQYYVNKWKIKYGLNENKIRKYFCLHNVIKTILNFYQNLFGLKFHKLKNKSNPSIPLYYVTDRQNVSLGYFYLDLFHRKNKIKDIRCFYLLPGCIYPMINGDLQLPIIALTASFKNSNKFTFLYHNEVYTLFHEFTHIVHQLVGKTKFSLFSGTNVEIDFIETPAQIIDNLFWTKNMIKKLSSHCNTGQPLPDDIIDKMIKIRNITIGITYKKHILISLYDQLLHSSEDLITICKNILTNDKYTDKRKEINSILSDTYSKLWYKIMSNSSNDMYSINILDDDTMPIEWPIFIFNGATYYSTLWNKVQSASIYHDKFHNKKINQKLGKEMIDKMLKFGGSIDAINILEYYLGRRPTIDGFLQLNDLLVNNDEFSYYFNTDTVNKINTDSVNDTEAYSNNFTEICSDSYTDTQKKVIKYLKESFNKQINEHNYICDDNDSKNKNIFIKN